MAYFELPDGVPLYYEDHGTGAPIVLIHGWTMNSTFWQGNIPGLTASGRVVTLDLRGHGASGKTPEGHSLAQYARDVRSLMEHLGLEDATLVGWSMGTDVILSYVEQYGIEWLRSVVFVDQSPRFLDGPDWEFPLFGAFSPTDLAVFCQTVRYARPTAIKPFIEACFAESPSSEVIDAIYAETTKTPTEAALEVWMDMAHADLRHVLADLVVPVLLVYGERSKVFPGDLAGRLVEALPKAEIARFEASGHAPFAEEPARFDEVISEFVARPNG